MRSGDVDQIRAVSRAIRVRLPVPMEEAVQALARNLGMSRSALLREIVSAGLRDRGAWPPRVHRVPGHAR